MKNLGNLAIAIGAFALGIFSAILIFVFFSEIGVLSYELFAWIPTEVLWIEFTKLMLISLFSAFLFKEFSERFFVMLGIGLFFGLSMPIGSVVAIPIDAISKTLGYSLAADFRLALIVIFFGAIQIGIIKILLSKCTIAFHSKRKKL